MPEPSAASDLAGKLHIWTSADGIAFAPVAYQDSICLEGINAWLRSQSLPEWSWSFQVRCLAFDVDFRGNWTSGFWPLFGGRITRWFSILLVTHLKGSKPPSSNMTADRLCELQVLGLTFRSVQVVGSAHPLCFALCKGVCNPELTSLTSKECCSLVSFGIFSMSCRGALQLDVMHQSPSCSMVPCFGKGPWPIRF